MKIKAGNKLVIRRSPTAPVMPAYIDGVTVEVDDDSLAAFATITIIDPDNSFRPDEQVTVGIYLLRTWVEWAGVTA